MPKRPLAVFFVYIWPEPQSSAAGVRTCELMHALGSAGWEVAAVSPSGEGRFQDQLGALGVATFTCDPNRSPESEGSLGSLAPALVIYDRFVMEEQFGWRARHLWPGALHLVDTQDLHAVRRARESLAQAGAGWERILSPTDADLGDDLLRELSSLCRCDGALVVSSWERAFLAKRLELPRLLCLPFPTEADPSPPGFAERSGFCFLGNFRHPPNLDSVRWLLELWPRIRAELPGAELHLYGAYPPAEISRHKGTSGILAHGPVADHRAALRKHRALLSPLRFGAGIKGKVLEAWGTGTPVLGSPLTFEGMGEHGPVARGAEELVAAARSLLTDENAWRRWQVEGLERVKTDFRRESLAEEFLRFVEGGRASLGAIREGNLLGRMLRHQQSNSTKYFSRWIEAKNLRQAASRPLPFDPLP
jgi:glycosyltransferase involved in cell wall biosynthesis